MCVCVFVCVDEWQDETDLYNGKHFDLHFIVLMCFINKV